MVVVTSKLLKSKLTQSTPPIRGRCALNPVETRRLGVRGEWYGTAVVPALTVVGMTNDGLSPQPGILLSQGESNALNQPLLNLNPGERCEVVGGLGHKTS